MANEMLDILMGKHLDGEITPDEQRLLDRFLADDEAAREEFALFRRLHEQTRWAVGQTLNNGQPMEEIFDAAWRKSSPVRRLQSRIFGREWALAAAGLAAGLVIGFVIHGMDRRSGRFRQADTGAAGPEYDRQRAPFAFEYHAAGNPRRESQCRLVHRHRSVGRAVAPRRIPPPTGRAGDVLWRFVIQPCRKDMKHRI